MSRRKGEPIPSPKSRNGLVKIYVDAIGATAIGNGILGTISQTRYPLLISVLFGILLFITSRSWDKVDIRFPRLGESARSAASSARLWIFTLVFIILVLGNSVCNFVFNYKISGYIIRGVPIQVSAYFLEDDLGSAVGPVQRASQLTVMRYDNAFAVWIDYKFFVIYANPTAHQVEFLPDVQPESRPSWFSEQNMRIQLGIPPDKCPPIGGFSHIWKPDMGYHRTDQIYGKAPEVFYQKYQKGWKIGPLPMDDGNLRSRAISINTSTFTFDQKPLPNTPAPPGGRIFKCSVDRMD